VRLFFVSNGYPPRGQWGTEFYTHALVRGLLQRGHEVAVLHTVRSGEKPRYTMERQEQDGVRVYLVHNPGDPKKRFLDSYANARVDELFGEAIAEWKPDLVHFLYLLWGLSVRLPLVAREHGVPRVMTLTDYGLLCHRGQMFDWELKACDGPQPPASCARCVREPSRFDGAWHEVTAKRLAVRALAAIGGAGLVTTESDFVAREAAVRVALSECQRLIAPTRSLAETFARAGFARERMTELVYAFDEAPYVAVRGEARERATTPGKKSLGFLGQFTPHKGLGTLVRAVELMDHRLPESVEDWEVQLYGSPAGGRHRTYADHVLGSYAGSRLRVMEPFPAVEAPSVLASLSAVVLPSEWDENAPLTVLQARAAGVPLVASDVPGVREVLEHGVHGLLVPPGDPPALADALRQVLLGRAPTPPAGAPLALDSHLDTIEGLYAELDGARA